MSQLGAVLLLLLPAALGVALLEAFGPKRSTARADFLLNVALGIGFGLGLSSVTFFLLLLTGGAAHPGVLVALEAVALLALGVWLGVRRRVRVPQPFPEEEGDQPLRGRLLQGAVGVMALVASASFVLQVLYRPGGGWDAIMVWNLRARFLVRTGLEWRQVAFDPLLNWSLLDKPLCVPAAVARAWSTLGDETIVVPSLLGFLFSAATVLLVSAVVTRLRGRTQGLLAALLLLGTAVFVRLGASMYADVPLAFFFTAALAALVLGEHDPKQRLRWTIVAGASAGLAAWTKNEGLPFLLLTGAACVGLRAAERDWRGLPRAVSALILGALPFVLLVGAFKLGLSGESYLVEGQGASTSEKLGDASRYGLILSKVFGEAVQRTPAPVALGYGLLLGLRPGWRVSSLLAPLVVLAAMLGAYCLVYVTTPLPLEWHLDKSLDRLLLQLWPGSVLVLFMAVKTPRELTRE